MKIFNYHIRNPFYKIKPKIVGCEFLSKLAADGKIESITIDDKYFSVFCVSEKVRIIPYTFTYLNQKYRIKKVDTKKQGSKYRYFISAWKDEKINTDGGYNPLCSSSYFKREGSQAVAHIPKEDKE